MDKLTSAIYPWQSEPWELLQSMVASDRLPHALIISGRKGIGLTGFALNFAASLLCEANTDKGEQCHQCAACHLLKAQTHPDLLIVEPEEAGKAIKVDQMRELISFSQLQSHYKQKKVIIINPAEAMNTSSANSLLKTLEEPPGDMLIMLLSRQPSVLPITVRSRCQKLRLSISEQDLRLQLADKLNQDQIEAAIATGFGPLSYIDSEDQTDSTDRQSLINDLTALSNANQDPLLTAEQWAKMPLNDTIFWLLKFTQDLVKIKSASTPADQLKLANIDLSEQLKAIASRFDAKGLFKLYDKLFEYHRLIANNTSLKPTTILEDLTIEWVNTRNK